MATTQYTTRNIPRPVDRYLRKRAHLSGKGLNQVIVEELSEKAADIQTPMSSPLGWFIGSGIDDATLEALGQEDTAQKNLAKMELSDGS